MKEKHSSLERQESEKGPNKRKWETARNWALGLSVLVNGGFIAENTKTHFDLKSLEDGQSQSFSIERADDNSETESAMNGINVKSGERGDFNLVRQHDGTWRLQGEVNRYYDNDPVNPVLKLDYELPALSPEVAQALFDDLKKATSTLNEQPKADQSGNTVSRVSPEEYMQRLIGLARKGTLTEYSAEYSPKENGIYRILELDTSGEKGPEITATYKGIDGDDQVNKISLDDLRAGALNEE